jgi:hypothetical protein|eukprot:SAG25_NODE_1297_length_3361_cov_6.543838_2_plen_149_part_00
MTAPTPSPRMSPESLARDIASTVPARTGTELETLVRVDLAPASPWAGHRVLIARARQRYTYREGFTERNVARQHRHGVAYGSGSTGLARTARAAKLTAVDALPSCKNVLAAYICSAFLRMSGLHSVLNTSVAHHTIGIGPAIYIDSVA